MRINILVLVGIVGYVVAPLYKYMWELQGMPWLHKMKKRLMALLVHNKTRWVGLNAEAERQGHPQSGQVTQ
jgi:hypothetical protein